MNKHVIGLATAPLIVAGMAGAIVSPAFADETGTLVGCANLQQTINEAADSAVTFMSLSEDCSADIIIPTGKSITLGTYHGSTLTNLYGDTITVEDGATLYLKGGNYENTSAGRSIIKNEGLTVIDYDRSVGVGASVPRFVTEVDAATWVVTNLGEMNILSAIVDSEFNIVVGEEGVLRIRKGGTNIDEERVAEYLVTGNCSTVLLNSSGILKYVPVGYSMTGNIYNMAQEGTDDGICGRSIYSSDDNIVMVTGTFSDGYFGNGISYAFEAKQAGTVNVYENIWENINSVPVVAYDLHSNMPGLEKDQRIISHVAWEYGRYYGGEKNNLILALENGEDISVDLNINEMEAEDINEDDAVKINAVLGDGKILAYGDISLEINASESGLIEKIHFLDNACAGGPNDSGLICEEYPIGVKWGGLDLGSPADGYKRNFYVIRLHDGETTKIAANVDKDGNLVFPSGKFSTYAVAYEDVEITTEDTAEETDATAGAPDTGAETQAGKNTALSLMGCMAAGIALALTMLPKIRKYLESRKA